MQQRSDGPAVQQIPLQDIAPHPDNRRHSGVGDVSDLAASIRALGVLEPVLVTPAQDYLASRPEHRDVVGARAYVLVAGQRRHAASAQAGQSAIPAIVRADLTGTDGLSAMVAENMHRLGMHPLDEAALFHLQVDLGATQRQIAERTGCSQPHVSKRLALLRLPQQVQDALGTGTIDLSDAQALGRLPEEDQASAWTRYQEDGGSLTGVAAAVVAERRQADHEARLRAEVEAAGLHVVNAEEVLGDEAERFRLVTESAVRQAAEEGRLLVDVRGGQRRDYLDGRTPGSLVQEGSGADTPPAQVAPIATPGGAVTPVPAQTDASGSTEQAERVKARTGRQRACQRACTGRPSASLLNEGLLQAALWRVDLRAHPVVELAGQFLAQGQPSTATANAPGVASDDWLWALRGAEDDLTQRRAGWALLLAARELRARETHRDWDTLDVRHLADLAAVAGYRPTTWEQARLDAAAATQAPRTDTQPLEEQ